MTHDIETCRDFTLGGSVLFVTENELGLRYVAICCTVPDFAARDYLL